MPFLWQMLVARQCGKCNFCLVRWPNPIHSDVCSLWSNQLMRCCWKGKQVTWLSNYRTLDSETNQTWLTEFTTLKRKDLIVFFHLRHDMTHWHRLDIKIATGDNPNKSTTFFFAFWNKIGTIEVIEPHLKSFTTDNGMRTGFNRSLRIVYAKAAEFFHSAIKKMYFCLVFHP